MNEILDFLSCNKYHVTCSYLRSSFSHLHRENKLSVLRLDSPSQVYFLLTPSPSILTLLRIHSVTYLMSLAFGANLRSQVNSQTLLKHCLDYVIIGFSVEHHLNHGNLYVCSTNIHSFHLHEGLLSSSPHQA